MALIEWNKQYVTGVKIIDDQHKRLIQIINHLNDRIAQEKVKRAEIEKVVDELISFTFNHFSTEEMYLEMYEYPDCANHKILHQPFLENILRFKGELEKIHMIDMSYVIATYLQQWMINHIVVEDMAYVPFLRKNMRLSQRQH